MATVPSTPRTAAAKTPPKKPGKPRPGVEKGDEVYFKAGDQHTHGRVASHGAHGCHIDHEGGRARVYWEDILGHKSRSAKSASVIDKGDDGFLMEDDHGRRRFVAGEAPKPDETAGDHEAVIEHARKATPLVKALGALDDLLVKSHVAAYTKKDGTFVAAHDDKRVKRAQGDAPVQRSLFDQSAKKPHVTETPSFKKWFGDSKVVDSSGKPLVVYHGTRADFEEFDASKNERLPGFWMATQTDRANGYAGNGTGSNVMPLYVSMQKPRVYDVGKEPYPKAWEDYEAGDYDGFIMVAKGEMQAIVAQRPEQIKSAIGNNGNFDPESPNMTKSIHDAPRVLFFKGGPIANRPGLTQKKITDRTGKQTTRWVKTAPDQPAQIRTGHHVKFQAGAHKGEGEVTAVGEHGVTAKDHTGREHQVRHEEVSHYRTGHDYESRKEGENDKQYAKRVVDKGDAVESLPEDHGRYFHTDGSTHVPIENLHSTKSDEENQQGGDNGPKRLKAAYHGALDKRAPITVMPHAEKDGHYEVVDGNGTLTSAKKLGWKGLPTKVVSREEGEAQMRAEKEKDAAKAAPAANKDDSNVVPITGPRSSEEISKALFDPREVENLPQKVNQPVDNWQDMLTKGKEGLPQFQSMLEKVAGALSLVKGKRPQSFDFAVEEENAKAEKEGRDAEALQEQDYMLPEHWDDEHGYLFMGPLKSEKRASEKVESDYEGDWSQLRDMVRATIAVPMVTQIPKVLAELKKAGIEMAQQPKNNLVRPLPGGYRDINMIVKLPNGMLAELQVHVKPMTLAKEKGHKHYETSRGIEAKYKANKKGRDDWSEDDAKAHADAMGEQEKLYGAAWEKAAGDNKNEPNLTKSLAAPIILLWSKKGEKNG